MSDTDYVVMWHDEQRTEQMACESCMQKVPLFNFNDAIGNGDRYLCEVCASTYIGNITNNKYGSYRYAEMNLAASLGACTNMILSAIRELKEG